MGRLITFSMIDDLRNSMESEPQNILKYSRVASAIFSSAVWGFGVERWLRDWVEQGIDGGEARGARNRVNAAMREILRLQGVSRPNSARTYFWHGALPCEYYDLDVWLKSL